MKPSKAEVTKRYLMCIAGLFFAAMGVVIRWITPNIRKPLDK